MAERPDMSRLDDLDLSLLPFTSEKDDWYGIANFPTTADMLTFLSGQTNADVFMVERALCEALGREYSMTAEEVRADMHVVLPRWLQGQKQVLPIEVGQFTKTHLAGSKVEFQITRTEEAYFVHLPR